MRLVNPKSHTVIDMYIAWTREVVAENPSYTTGYDYLSKIAGVKVIYDGQKQMFMTYTMFRCIIETYNKNICNAVVEGGKFDLGGSLGYIFPARVERNFSRPQADMNATMQAKKLNPDHPRILYTEDEYVLIKWQKRYRTRNESVYRFTAAKHSMKTIFSQANKNNPILRSAYKFYPFIKATA